MSKVLCCVPTHGRYFTTLPLVLNAIILQSKQVDKLVIFDDNDEPQDMRNEPLYQFFFSMLNDKQIEWEWIFAEKKGQHHIHQAANEKAVREGFEFVWRCDDDAIPEHHTLYMLYRHINDRKGDVGAVGGAVLMPQVKFNTSASTGRIEDISNEPNIQWAPIEYLKDVEHLHCTFIYRAGVYDFNLGLSRVAHREETLFSWGIHKKGYRVLVVPNATTFS
jgi:glycosyltransferase involved in cell wall biosynthesis